MAGKSRLPFKMTPLFCRYLRDMQFGQEDREKPDRYIEPREWFLINTYRSGEVITDTDNENLEAFKSFLEENDVAHFPTLAEYSKKVGVEIRVENALTALYDEETNEWYEYENHLPVHVLDLNKLIEFRRKHCAPATHKVSSQYRRKEQLYFIGNTLYLQEKVIHSFTSPSACLVFKTLWSKRKHTVKGVDVSPAESEPVSSVNFMYNAGLTTSRSAPLASLKMKESGVRTVVTNAGTNLDKRKFRMSLSFKNQKSSTYS